MYLLGTGNLGDFLGKLISGALALLCGLGSVANGQKGADFLCKFVDNDGGGCFNGNRLRKKQTVRTYVYCLFVILMVQSVVCVGRMRRMSVIHP